MTFRPVVFGAVAMTLLGVAPWPYPLARLGAQATDRERSLYVSVLDRDGAPVPGLSPSDFIVREDGMAREVLRVRPASEPMQIALLVDTSQAATQPMSEIRDAATRFVDRMAKGNEIALIAFGDRPTIVVDYTDSLIRLKEGIGRLFPRPDSGAYLLDAIVETARGFQKREALRPVMVAITTEGTEFSNHTYQTVLQRLNESGAAFHAVVLESGGADFFNDGVRNRNMVLDQGTTNSGGRRDNLLSSIALEDRLEQVARDLSSQYLVTYARPESLIPPERVQVSMTKPGLVARRTPARGVRGA